MLIGRSIQYFRSVIPKLPLDDAERWQSFTDDVESAIKFDVGDVDDIPQIEKGLENDLALSDQIQSPKLPYSKVYFEAAVSGKKYGAFFEYDDGKVAGQALAPTTINKGHWIVHPVNLFFLEEEDGVLSFSKDRILCPDDVGLDTFWALLLMIEAIKIINCSNIIIHDNKPKAGVNKKRIIKGKPPLYTYKTLHIDTSEKETTKGPGGGTHASPRVHLRRGHIRKLPSGKTIWVQPCVVGKNTDGIVDKDYSLVDPTTIHAEVPMTVH